MLVPELITFSEGTVSTPSPTSRDRRSRTGFCFDTWDQYKSNQSSCNVRTKSDLAPSEVALSLNQERALAGMYGALFLPRVGTNVPKPRPRRARVMRLTFRILLHQLPKVQTSDSLVQSPNGVETKVCAVVQKDSSMNE